VLFVVAASLNETTTLNWQTAIRPKTALIHLDIDADRIGRNYPVDVSLLGDARVVLTELEDRLRRLIREQGIGRSEWSVRNRGLSAEHRYMDAELRTSNQMPLTPQRWRTDLGKVLPDDAIIFSDIGGHMLFNIHHLCIGSSQRFVLNFGFGSMGHGTAAPIGAAIAHPDRPVFTIIGDACFTMNGMEIITAREYGVPLIWIVENNNMHGITWHGSKRVGRKRPLESIRYKNHLDIAAIARAMGLDAWVVDAPGQIQSVVEYALACGRPAVIEVRVDPTISPPLGDRARSIAGFVKK
jgi:acetolactate synthase-1/2/3 large subunit